MSVDDDDGRHKPPRSTAAAVRDSSLLVEACRRSAADARHTVEQARELTRRTRTLLAQYRGPGGLQEEKDEDD